MSTAGPDISRILVIDDSADIHRLLKIRLRDINASIISAFDGREGLAMARVEQPDLILLDIDMPGMGGFETLQMLKTDPNTVAIPVIFLSGSGNAGDKVRGFDLGAVDYVTKPFDVSELRARVRSALRTQHLLQMLSQRAQLDGLTGLWNRRHLDERLAEFIASATRHGRELSLIIGDIDHFKALNDTYGHPFGDQVLVQFARLLVSESRESDVACRYGGEEFAVMLPDTGIDDARVVAERYRKSLELRTWPLRQPITVTASFGIACMGWLASRTAERLIEAADRALYAAKRGGRNQVRIAEDSECDTATTTRSTAPAVQPPARGTPGDHPAGASLPTGSCGLPNTTAARMQD